MKPTKDMVIARLFGQRCNLLEECKRLEKACEGWKSAYQQLFTMVEAGATIKDGKVDTIGMDSVLYAEILLFRHDCYKSEAWETGDVYAAKGEDDE